jgi:hypothetical protein
VTLRKVREFTDPTDARTARQLTRQVAELEENVAAETASIRADHLPRFASKGTGERSSGVIVAPGESLGVDTTSDSIEVILQQPGAKTAGMLAAVYKRVAANTLTLRPAGDALVNGTSVLAVTSVGLTLLLSDGKNYWT